MAKVPAFGEGEEYELGGGSELVHTEEKSLTWRRQNFEQLGFSKVQAKNLARWRSADLNDMRRWIEREGCSLDTAYAIVEPVDVIPPEEETSTELARREP